MSDINKLRQEKAELSTLINTGISFEVEDVEFEVKRFFFGLIKKRIPVKVVRKFKVDEPTLATLDRLSAEWIEFDIDEALIRSKDGMRQARTFVTNHAIRCAKVIALAVLGSDYLIPKYVANGVVRYVEDVQRLEYLTGLFARAIKPSDLYQLYVQISVMCNLGDFMNSIRLMSTSRTTMPIRIEEKKDLTAHTDGVE